MLIDADLAPDARVAGVVGGVGLPCVVAEFAGARDGVEDPEALTGAHIEAAHVAFHIGLAVRHAAGEMCRSDNDDVVCNCGRGRKADITLDQIHGLIVVELEIDDAMAAEGRNRDTVLRVQRYESVAERDIVNAFLPTVGPVGQAAAGDGARRVVTSYAFDFAVHPAEFPGGRIDRNNIAPRASRGVEDPVRHQRRAFEIVFGKRAERDGFESPGQFELIEIGGVDLAEGRVSGMAGVAAVGVPFASGRAFLRKAVHGGQ